MVLLRPTLARLAALGLTGLLLAGCAAPAAAPTAGPATQPPPTAAPAPTDPPAPAATATDAPAEAAPTAVEVASAEPVTFQIVAEQSQASFTINEVLRGQPTTVVGTTRAVSGELRLDLQDLSRSTVGVITVQVGGLATDSGFRDRAIRDFILNTGQYPAITFTPTAITGLSGAAQPGQPVTFQITGDLTIRTITRPATFEVTATGASTTELAGTATTTVQRSDFDLIIPSVPQVADVSQAVILTLDFVAVASN